jgi:hypothetical protein
VLARKIGTQSGLEWWEFQSFLPFRRQVFGGQWILCLFLIKEKEREKNG